MITVFERIYETLEKEKARNLLALIFYVSFIITLVEPNLPVPLYIIIIIFQTITAIAFYAAIYEKLMNTEPSLKKNMGRSQKNHI